MTATNEKSEYFESLSEEDKKGYLEKLTLSTGKQLPDPFILHSNWSNNVSLLLDISYPHIYLYLIEHRSQFSIESLTLKPLGWVNFTPLCGFSKKVSSKERVKL